MGVGWVPSELCVGLLLANHDNRLQQVPFSQTAALTKNHYHSDSIGYPSWVPHRICFKELSRWQPGEMGGPCFPIHSQEKAERLATLGDYPTRAATAGRWIACLWNRSPVALLVSVSPLGRLLPLSSRPISEACGTTRPVIIQKATSQREVRPLVGTTAPYKCPVFPPQNKT